MIGSRSVRWRSISNEAEPEPIITPARSSIVGTPLERRISPVFALADIWGESESSEEVMPPR